ncbi:WD repeat-containing protein 55-like isoform X2 [Patiria miniata]|uniref:WD repeat-containing protein 55 homolog n=1 Tax=Patiria miniata TaxID=46514 RepID=A0A913ZVJ9_PATMI|nr:WD repeat-containing protein 55-like isoform X2 [Patiria miniata]
MATSTTGNVKDETSAEFDKASDLSDSDDEEESDSEEEEVEEEEDAECDETVPKPKTITCDDMVTRLSCHPSDKILAAAMMDGTVKLFSYSTETPNEEIMSLSAHQKACRGVAFSEDGKTLYTISRDKSLRVFDVTTGHTSQQFLKAHSSPLYCLLVADENLIATADDDGQFKVWDLRKKHAIMEVKENEDYISDMAIDKAKRIIVASSGDGTMSTFNIRRRKFVMQSENVQNEMMTITIVKDGKKIICGVSDGALNMYNWNEFGDLSDRFPGHPQSVDACVALTDSIVCTGSMDGMIRAVSILPNRFLGVVGDHDDFPIESLAVTPDKNVLISCSHDQKIKFWNVSHLLKKEVDPQAKAEPKNKFRHFNAKGKHENFFAGLT